MNDDARYAQVLRWPNREELARRLPPLLLGISLMGFAIALSVRAELGLAPWDVFHQGLAGVFDLELGTVAVLVGLVVLIAWIPLHQQLGVGTIINTLTVGLVANVGLAVVPEQQLLTVRIPMLVCALLGFGLGSGLYIGAGLGPGPRDGLMTAIAARGHRIWVVRTVLECSVLVVGVALGGKVGIGTVLLAFGLGPLTHAALRRFHLPVDDGAPEVLGE
jgi:uncharacterized membrane protein YczE